MSRREIFEKFRSDQGFTIGGTPVLEKKEVIECNNNSFSESDDEVEAFNKIIRKKPKIEKVREFYRKKAEIMNEEDEQQKPYMTVFKAKSFVEPKKDRHREKKNRR